MNFVERTTWRLIESLITGIDPNRDGWCIDAGAGGQDFYFEWFDSAGYKTILIEPLPVEQVQDICHEKDIPLFAAALAAETGRVRLSVHDDPNRHTLRGDLWPDDYNGYIEVPTISLADVAVNIDRITALKLDIEGAEPQVLQTITADNAPDVIAFEFGGQVSKAHGTGAWSDDALLEVFKSTQHLRDIGYENGVIIAAGAGEHIRPLNFQTPDFKMTDGWGNIIITKERELCLV